MIVVLMGEKIDKNRIITRIKKRKNEIKKYGVRKIGLFGSYLDGRQKRGSDIDILVELDKNTFDNYFGLWVLLEKIFNKKIDLVIEKSLRPELDYVKKEAVYVEV